MSQVNYVTKDTFDLMQAELQHMKGVERPSASRAIAEAREKGDLKENAEYDAAKEAQGMLEAKIKQLETIIATARIVDESTIDTSKVSILTKVTLTNLNTKKQVTYQIVDTSNNSVLLEKHMDSKDLGAPSDQLTVENTLPMAGLQPGKYKVTIRVNDRISKQEIAQSAPFVVE